MAATRQKRRISWPKKSSEMQNHHMDSTRWNAFEFRDSDIIIGTWAKSGTTWVQQIVGQLIFGGRPHLPTFDLSPWVDHRVFPLDELLAMLGAQEHRRFLKTHLPVSALVFSPKAKYIYIGRDGRDVLWSWYNHHSKFTQMAYELMNDTPGRVGPPLPKPGNDIRRYFHEWLDGDGYPLWPFWSHVQSWWDIRSLPNVMLLHFDDLKRDLRGETERIAEFLEIDADESLLRKAVEYSEFDFMKKHASKLSPILDEAFEGGAKSFVHKGTNERWRDVLTYSDVLKYEVIAAENLSPDCAEWLANGSIELQ